MGGVIRHAKTVLIRQKGDDMKVFMWKVHKVPVRCHCYVMCLWDGYTCMFSQTMILMRKTTFKEI